MSRRIRALFSLRMVILAAVIAVCSLASLAQTPADPALVPKFDEAESLFGEASKLVQEGTAESSRSAIAKFKSASSLYHGIGSKLDHAVTLNNIGSIYAALNENQAAIEYFNQSLAILRQIGARQGEAKTLNNIGKIYDDLGEKQKALEYYSQSLAIKQQVGDHRGEAVTLNNIGSVYDALGERQKAIEYYNRSLAILRQFGERQGEAATLNNIGKVYDDLGEKQKALEYFNQSLAIERQLGNRHGEATALNNIGSVYDALGEKQKALEYYNQSLPIKRQVGDRRGEAITLHNIGMVYNALGETRKALEYYNQSLVIERQIGNREGEAATLNSIGLLYSALGEQQKALEYYNQSLPISRQIGDREGEATTLNNLMFYWHQLGRNAAAVFYGKQAVNIFQELRSNIKDFDKVTQAAYVKSIESSYRTLADILIGEGRLIEAQSILDLIKDSEYRQVATRTSGEADTVPYSKTENEVVAKVENLMIVGREQAELRKEQKELGDKFPADRLKRLDQLNADIKLANAEFDTALAALGKADAGVEARTLEIKGEKNLQSALQSLGKDLNTGAVALYTVLGTEEDKAAVGGKSGQLESAPLKTKFGWVILVTPRERKAYPINVEDLEQTVFQFREALSSDKFDPRPLAEKIYDAIFRQTSAKQKTTLESDLREIFSKQQNKTLMWSLDGVLRYIPMAALHDGKGYLVEKYRSVTFTKESLLWLMNQPKPDARALGLGVSAGNVELQMSALPGVDKELSDIIKQTSENTGILSGTRKVNAGFKKQEVLNLKDEDNSFQIVHIASHYSFNPIDQNASYLLVGDGKLTFGEMKDESNLFGTVDLLTLSACDTGVSGNGKEAEGFAYLAQSLGAKSVIASLWKVSDAGTPELMIRFYKLRAANPQISKGEAFRKAQLEMMGLAHTPSHKEKMKPPQNRADILKPGSKSKLTPYNPEGKPKYAHPHYWAPFVLIGNWR